MDDRFRKASERMSMKCQHFAHDAVSVASIPLTDASGKAALMGNFRGQSNLVLLFSHGLGCQHCQWLVEQLATQSQELIFADAQVLVVQPSNATREASLSFPMHLVWDCEGAAWHKFARLIEQPVTQDDILVVILDRYGALQAACSVSHGNDGNLVAEILEYLKFIAIQCPE
ncbi:MAG: hypothetical protein ACP5R2_10245 [Anaerolineae bacterium]